MKRNRKAAHLSLLKALDAKADAKQAAILTEIARRANGIDQAVEDWATLCSDPTLDDLIEIHDRANRAWRYLFERASPEQKERMVSESKEYEELAKRIRAQVERLIERAA